MQFLCSRLSAMWLAACAGISVVVFLVWAALRRRRQATVHHMLRLASDIAAVAANIDDDLPRVRTQETASVLHLRCRESRANADEALAQRTRLTSLSLEHLKIWLAQLYDDHRRIVDLRLDVDTALTGNGSPAKRACHFASGSSSRRSQWPSSGFHTRPSTLT